MCGYGRHCLPLPSANWFPASDVVAGKFHFLQACNQKYVKILSVSQKRSSKATQNSNSLTYIFLNTIKLVQTWLSVLDTAIAEF